MFEVKKVENYKTFAKMLEVKTGCEIKIKIMKDESHVHYELLKHGLSLGVLCIDKGKPSFAPFVNLDTAENDQFINCSYMPMFDDFIDVLNAFKEIFVYEPDGVV